MLCPISYHISAKDRVRSGDEFIRVYAMPQASADTGRLEWHFSYRGQIGSDALFPLWEFIYQFKCRNIYNNVME